MRELLTIKDHSMSRKRHKHRHQKNKPQSPTLQTKKRMMNQQYNDSEFNWEEYHERQRTHGCSPCASSSTVSSKGGGSKGYTPSTYSVQPTEEKVTLCKWSLIEPLPDQKDQQVRLDHTSAELSVMRDALYLKFEGHQRRLTNERIEVVGDSGEKLMVRPKSFVTGYYRAKAAYLAAQKEAAEAAKKLTENAGHEGGFTPSH
jgi:hypothetical protein